MTRFLAARFAKDKVPYTQNTNYLWTPEPEDREVYCEDDDDVNNGPRSKEADPLQSEWPKGIEDRV